MSFLLRNLPVRAFDSCAQGFSIPLARRRSSCSPPSPRLVLTHPIERPTVRLRMLLRPTRLSVTVAPASRMPPPSDAPNWSSEEAHPVNTILNQPYHRRPSTDRLNRKDSQLVVSPEGESSPTPAGKTLPHFFFFFFLFFFFNLTYSRWTSSLPSCLWSLRIFPSFPGSRLTIFYRDTSSALLQLVNHSRCHAFRYERKNTNPTLVRIELTTSALAGVQVTY